MLSRRQWLRHTSQAALAGAAANFAAAGWAQDVTDPQLGASGGVIVNDMQSKLNATRVAEVMAPTSLAELQAALAAAAKADRFVSLCGGRHAMGGQQFGTDTALIDTGKLKRVVAFDPAARLLTVEAGIMWPELIDYLHAEQAQAPTPLSIRQKQTGVDNVSLGGSLAANGHGRGLKFPPLVSDVESFVLIDAAGEAHTCSRAENAELFSLAIGGYGLFGVIAQVTLRLVPRVKLKRVVEVVEVRDLPRKLAARLDQGFQYGDCQYSTDVTSDAPHQGVLSCYQPVPLTTPIPADQRHLTAEDWGKLIYLGHVDRAAAFKFYAEHYLSTSGQIYWSDTHQMGVKFGDYHVPLDEKLGAKHPGSEMITEVYVRPDQALDFLKLAKADAREHKMDIIYGTLRFIERDSDSFLAWAKERQVCALCNLHINHTPEGIAKAQDDFRRLIGRAVWMGGRYFLTYHRWATRELVLAAYPQFIDFLRLKLKYDPKERFQSTWYRHYRAMFKDKLP